MPTRLRTMLDHQTAEYMQISYQKPPQEVPEYLLRQAGLDRSGADVPLEVGHWFIRLANGLGASFDENGNSDESLEGVAAVVADRLCHDIPRGFGPAILAVLEPETTVPAHKAGSYRSVCRNLIGTVLPGTCRRILRTWWASGSIHGPNLIEN